MTSEMKKTTGGVTLPAETGQEKVVVELMEKWGADTIRDSDGTELSQELVDLGENIYSTVCVVRADQEWSKAHMDELPRKFLMSNRITASSTTVEIPLMERYFDRKYKVDIESDPKKYWEVIDRSSGEVIDIANWEFIAETGVVKVSSITPYHVYTVNFMVVQVWDSTSMYNHMTNNWTSDPIVSVDPYYPATYQHTMDYFDKWLKEHPNTTVVRLTTLAYHFNIDSGPEGVTVFRDWQGYTDTITPPALDDFEKEYGYKFRAEFMVDEGYYNLTDRVPCKEYLDWMEFIHKFVVRFGKDLCGRAHADGRRTAAFWGDHGAGMEPYSPDYQKIGIDVNIGACGDGVSLRRVADAPGTQETEVRFYPYFFPDVFRPGGDPLGESTRNWIMIRRAMLRNPVDRVGYGGYLSLAIQFPEFVDHVADLCDQFRQIRDYSREGKSRKAPVKVAVLTAWGALRSWSNSKGVGFKFMERGISSNMLECLAGLPVEVSFISFDDIAKDGIPSDLDVIINEGEPNSAWSGGRHWARIDVVTSIREWINNGGGFIGVGGPTAYEFQGRMFQLSDVMGVQLETGESLASPGIAFEVAEGHFIMEDTAKVEMEKGRTNIAVVEQGTDVLQAHKLHVQLAARSAGKGRSVFINELPYSLENSRMFLRALLWSAGKESELKKAFSSNVFTDCAMFEKQGVMAVTNNSDHPQTTTLYDINGKSQEIALEPLEMKWV